MNEKANQSLKQFYTSLLFVSEDAGLKTLSDDYCCKLLAWLYAYGGALEAVTLHTVLNPHILLAQKRLNLYGGESQDEAILTQFLAYKKEVAPYVEFSTEKLKRINYKHPQWVLDIHKRYSLPLMK